MNIPIDVLKNTIIDADMDLEELVYERLDMSLEDLLYEVHHRLVERREYFEDLDERIMI